MKVLEKEEGVSFCGGEGNYVFFLRVGGMGAG